MSIGYILVLMFMAAKQMQRQTDEKAPSASLSSIFLGLKWNGKPNSILYVLMFLSRRLIFGIIVVMLRDYPMYQLFTMTMTSSMMVLLLAKFKPYAMPHNLKL